MRKQEREISLQLVNEVMDKKVLGSAGPRLPDTQAKRHLALSAAAKAVVIALTPGMPPLQRMTILPRGQSMARTLFTPQVTTTPPPQPAPHPTHVHMPSCYSYLLLPPCPQNMGGRSSSVLNYRAPPPPFPHPGWLMRKRS